MDRLLAKEPNYRKGDAAVTAKIAQNYPTAVINARQFDFDMGYMFNECFVTDNDILVFDEHLPGEGKDLITAYDLHKGRYLMHQEENADRTFNGEKTMTVKNEQTGMDIVAF